jgi:hypothetical protein
VVDTRCSIKSSSDACTNVGGVATTGSCCQ